jgi:hypothetical protein
VKDGWCELHGDNKPCDCPDLDAWGRERANLATVQGITVTDSRWVTGRWEGDNLVFDHYHNGVYVGTSDRF